MLSSICRDLNADDIAVDNGCTSRLAVSMAFGNGMEHCLLSKGVMRSCEVPVRNRGQILKAHLGSIDIYLDHCSSMAGIGPARADTLSVHVFKCSIAAVIFFCLLNIDP